MATSTFKGQKACIFGIQGSGKTHWAKKCYAKFKKPIIFQVNEDDGWAELDDIYVYKANRNKVKEEFFAFISKARDWALAGKIDLIIVDEADLFFQSNWEIDSNLLDLVLNHRHFGKEGVALWFLTRRPQDIPTKIVESSKFLVIFKLEGFNAIQRFKDINPKLPELIEQLDYETHNFIVKEIGKDPKIYNSVTL